MNKKEYIRERSVFLDGQIITMTDEYYRILQSQLFLRIWKERKHQCDVSAVPLGMEPRSYYFHHILEKRSFEKYALCKWNIIILSWEIHNSYESNPDNQPILKALRNDLLYKLETLNYEYDNDLIFDVEENSKTHITDIFGNNFQFINKN
jgi:hypothetical protein